MAVTRINNNQITDASAGNVYVGINAGSKLQAYSITAGKIANNLTYGSNLTVTGNLTVQGTTTAIDTVNTLIQDPLITLADGQTVGTPTVDIGLIGLRGSQNSSFIGWKESSLTFVTALSNTTVSNTTVNINSYANLVTGNLTVQGTTSLVGNLIGAVQATGNITGGNLLTPGLISATGGVTASSVAGGVITGTSTSVTGTQTAASTVGGVITGSSVSVTGNVTGGNVLFGTGNVSGTGNVAAGYFIGNGSQLTGVTASSVNANSLTGTVLNSGVVTSSLTSVGVLTSLSVSGNVTAGNVAATNHTGTNVSVTGTATAASTVGGVITGTSTSVTGSQTAASTVGGVITGSSSSVTGSQTAASTVGGIITGSSSSVTGTQSAASTVGGVITGTSTSVTGSQTAASTVGGVITGTSVSVTANVTGGNLVSSTVTNPTAMTVRTNAGNINLSPAGNIVLNTTYINGLQLTPVQDADAASKYYVDQAVTTGITIHEAVYAATNTTLAIATGGTVTYAQPNGVSNGVGATLTTTGTYTTIDTANVQTVGRRILVKDQANAVQNGVYVYSNATVITRSQDTDQYGSSSTEELSYNDYFFTTNGNVNAGTAFIVNAPTGTITFGTSNIGFGIFSQSQVYTANTAAGLVLNGTVFSAKVDNNTTAFDGSGNISVKAGANLTTPNIGAATGTSLSVTGAVTAASTVGGVITGSSSSVTGTQTAASTVGGVITGSSSSVTGSQTAASTVGGVITGTSTSVTGNVTGGNVLTGGLLSATANITGGNILTGGIVSAAGNITANPSSYFIGNGSQLTGVTSSTSGFPVVAGTSNIAAATSGNIGISIAATSNVVTIATSGQYVTGVISANGNITGGNINTGGIVSASGNIVTGTGGFIGIRTSTPDSELNILATPQTVSYSLGGNSTTSGTDLHISGADGSNTRITQDAFGTGSYVAFTGRVAGGTAASPTQTQSGDIMAEFTGRGFSNGTLQFGNASTGKLDVVAAEAFTDTSRATNVAIYTTASGAITPTAIATFSSASGLSVTGGITATGNANIASATFFVNSSTSTASFGNSTQTTNALVSFNSTNSIKVPVGNTAQRPAVGVTGMQRFNTTSNSLEMYYNSAWTDVGAPVFTVIADQQFNGDGATVAFTLSSTQTTNSCIVSINGVVQIPTIAYAVAGTNPTCVLTFTEAPSVGDIIDVRQITTTTSVTSIANSSGNAVVAASDTAAQINVTGALSATGNITSAGNISAGNLSVFAGSVTLGSIVNYNANGVGNIGSSTTYFNTVFAKATSAQYADLAEKYTADAEYAPGTVLVFGGTHEVTVNATDSDRKVAGVVSTNPSYIMNAGLEGEHVATVALTGRVPTMVVGPVRKGDMMVSAGLGRARPEADPQVGAVIGKALEDFDGDEGTIEVVVGRF